MRQYLNVASNILRKPLQMGQLPIHIQLEPTTYCNLNCKMCGRSQYLQHAAHLEVAAFQRILDQIHPQKITFSGLGEPLTHPHLFEMVRLAKEQGCSINTTTNATLFTPARSEQIVNSGLDLIKISIDGATRQTYQFIRGEDQFLQVLDGIRALNDAKKQAASLTPFIRLNYVMSNANYHEIKATVELAKSLGVDAIYFQPLELVGIEDRQHALVGNLTYDVFAHELRQAADTARQLGVNTNLSGLLRKLSAYWKKYQLETRKQDSRICILPWFSTYITVDGYVRPCCSFSQTDVNLGNILTTDMPDIWNGEQYQQFRQAMRAGQRPYPICANCVPQGLLDIVGSADILPGFFR